MNEQGEKEKDAVTTSQALQIAGRAGRFASAFPDGEVTTFRRDDLPLLKDIVSRQVETIKVDSLSRTDRIGEKCSFFVSVACWSSSHCGTDRNVCLSSPQTFSLKSDRRSGERLSIFCRRSMCVLLGHLRSSLSIGR